MTTQDYRGKTIYNPFFVSSADKIPTRFRNVDGTSSTINPQRLSIPGAEPGTKIYLKGSQINQNILLSESIGQIDNNEIYSATIDDVYHGGGGITPGAVSVNRNAFYIVLSPDSIQSFAKDCINPSIASMLQNSEAQDQALIAGLYFKDTTFVLFRFPNGVNKVATILEGTTATLQGDMSFSNMTIDQIKENYEQLLQQNIISSENITTWDQMGSVLGPITEEPEQNQNLAPTPTADNPPRLFAVYSEEQATSYITEILGPVDLSNLAEGNFSDKFSPFNRFIIEYRRVPRGSWKVYLRPINDLPLSLSERLFKLAED